MTGRGWLLLGGAAVVAWFVLGGTSSAAPGVIATSAQGAADTLLNLAHGAGATDTASVRGWMSGSSLVPPPNTGGFRNSRIAGAPPAAADSFVPTTMGPTSEARSGAAHF